MIFMCQQTKFYFIPVKRRSHNDIAPYIMIFRLPMHTCDVYTETILIYLNQTKLFVGRIYVYTYRWWPSVRCRE